MSETLIDRGVLAGTGYDRSTQYESINEIALAVQLQADLKRDYIVDTRRMSCKTDDDGTSILTWDGDGVFGTDSGLVKDHAHGQIAARLNIPSAYYKRMQMENPWLLDANVNSWFYAKPERRMLRTIDGKVRAFLSDRYRRMDNIDLMAQAIIPALTGGIDGLHFQVASLTDERLHVNALLRGLAREIKVGDIVQAGIQIKNSEVGSGALSVTPRVWRLSCLNGLLVNVGQLSRNHVGRKADDEAYEIYRDDTLAADDAAFFLKVRDAITAALTEASFETIVAQLRETVTGERIQDPVKITELLTQRFSMNETEGARLLRYLASGGDMSRWGAVNAITAAAKDADTFDRQAEIETAGGQLVSLPERDWAALAAA